MSSRQSPLPATNPALPSSEVLNVLYDGRGYEARERAIPA